MKILFTIGYQNKPFNKTLYEKNGMGGSFIPPQRRGSVLGCVSVCGGETPQTGGETPQTLRVPRPPARPACTPWLRDSQRGTLLPGHSLARPESGRAGLWPGQKTFHPDFAEIPKEKISVFLITRRILMISGSP